MASLMSPQSFAPPLLLPPPDPPPFVLPPDLSTVVFPPEPPDPPDSLYRSSMASPSILQVKFSDLDLKQFQVYNLVASFSLMPSVGTPFASLRSITAVCSSWYQAFHVTCLELWISPPRLSHPLVTPFEGFVSVRGSSISELFAFSWNMPSIISQLSQYKDVMILSIFMLLLPQYEAVLPLFNLRPPLPLYEAAMPWFNLRLPLPQYEVVMISIRLKLLLPHHEAVMSLIKLRLPLPQYEDLLPLSAWILWFLWKSRNLLIFENRDTIAEDSVSKAICAAKEWQAAQLATHSPARARCTPLPLIEDSTNPLPLTEDLSTRIPRTEVQLLPLPPHEVIYCFTDAAWNASTGSCGMGWIFKTQDHRVIHQGSATRLHTPSALAAEALAMKYALIAASRMEFTSIKVSSDSQVLISLLNTETSTNELQGILHDIAFASLSFLSIKFTFVPRNANLLADALAKSVLASLDVLSA
ncbi:Ribonuclease H-like superfamily [Arabidopsis suecica]|uniref:Ribonuclease H-like superfamily n=1 Tax=Arabidopsis suecica TaxID=45249 RepID=A0A8T1Z6X2_ARASU|nr:Ribonuclease H-like superfamily [Arabidopsis suecica]